MRFIAFLIMISLLSSSVFAGITGLSRVEIQDDTIFGSSSGKVWVLNWNAIDTDQISGSVSPSEFQSFTGVASDGSFSLSMTSGDEYAEYRFFSSAELRPVFTSRVLYYTGWNDDTTSKWVVDNCRDVNGDVSLINGVDYSWFESGIGYDKVACVDKQSSQLATTARIRSPETIFTTTFTLSGGGETQTKTFSNANNVGSTDRFGNLALIKWQGSLTTGKKAPEPIGVLGAHTGGSWRIIDSINYNTWDSYMKNSLGECLDRIAQGTESASFCESQMNNRAVGAVVVTGNSIFSNVQITDSSTTNGKFRLDKDINGQPLEGMSIPQFQVFLNADKVKLVVPTGKPQIVSVSAIDIQEIGSGKVTATFKNIGSSAGGFEARVSSCSSSEFSPTGVVQRFNLNAGQSVSKEFSIGFNSAKTTDVTASCTVVLKETTTGETVTQNVNVKGVQSQDCNPNQRYAGVDPATGREAIYQCDANGQPSGIVQVCDAGQRVENQLGTLVCKGVDQPIQCPPGTLPEETLFGFGETKCEPIAPDDIFRKPDFVVYGIGSLLIVGSLASLGIRRFGR